MRQFSKSYQNGIFTLSNDERVSVTHIETHGRDLDDFLSNAEISFEDWHGNCTHEGWTIGDLSQNDYAEIERLFIEHLADGPELES